MKTISILYLLMILPLIAVSQWNSDPNVNTLVANANHQNSFPKIASDKNGNCYISSWIKLADSTYNFELRLQRLDTNGNRLWPDSGLLVSRNKCRTWLSDYSLVVDTAGNAVIFLEDIREETVYNHVFGYSISPAGIMRWGAEGIRTDTNSVCSSYSPRSIITSAGNILAGWNILYGIHAGDTSMKNMGIQVMKLSPGGTPLWPAPKAYTGADSTYMFPNLVPMNDDGFLMVWTRYVNPPDTAVGGMSMKYIYAQRYDPLGNPVWPANTAICDLDTLAYLLPDFPDWAVVPDISGGAFVAWNDGRDQNSFDNVFVQHVDSDGNLMWPLNGIPVSPVSYGSDREMPGLCYLPGTDELLAFWSELKILPQGYCFELTGQKFSHNGNLLWTDTGKVVCSSGPDSIYYLFAVKTVTPTEAIIFYNMDYIQINGTDTSSSEAIFGARVDTDGNLAWDQGYRLLAGDMPLKYGQVVTSAGNQFVIAWSENRAGSPLDESGEIYVQNISPDGKLGPLGISPGPARDCTYRIVPNPSTGRSMVILPDLQEGYLEISAFSIDGREQKRFTTKVCPDPQQVMIDGSSLVPGLYLVKVTCLQDQVVIPWVISR